MQLRTTCLSIIAVTLVVMASPRTAAAPPEPPEGHTWVVNDKFTIHPSTKYDDTPFDRPMHTNLVAETYDLVTPPTPTRQAGTTLLAAFMDDASGLEVRWSAAMDDKANYVIQSLQLTARQDAKIEELVFIDAPIDGARQVGHVDGSVVVCGDIFMAVEHPLAKNTVDKNSHVRCALPRGNVLKAGKTWCYTSVLGVVEPSQLRRGFLAYLERCRAHPYRPFLHYNSWYHLNIGRPDNHMTEAECLETIDFFGRELIGKRGAKMDAFVWDDGWDDFNSLWGFHKDFPQGFKNLDKAGAKYGTAQGVWMSPWGGLCCPPDWARLRRFIEALEGSRCLQDANV